MFFFFNEPAPPEIHTHAPSLPLHDSLPISLGHFPSPSRRHSCGSAFPARANLFDRPRATMLVVSIHRALARAKQIPPGCRRPDGFGLDSQRSEEHTSELQSLMRISYAVFCLKKQNKDHQSLTSTLYK